MKQEVLDRNRTLVLDLNPRVRDIIKQATQEAKPLWFGLTNGDTEIWERRAVWMLEIAPDLFENGNQVSWTAEQKVIVDNALLSISKNGEPFIRGCTQRTYLLHGFDSVIVAAGALVFRGSIPDR